MSLKDVLNDLVASIPGARGAMFLDQEGEAVAVAGSDLPAYDLQVIGAYSGIFLSNAQRVSDELDFGTTERVKIQCRESDLFITRLSDGYYLVLVLKQRAHEGVAWQKIVATRDRLNEEIA